MEETVKLTDEFSNVSQVSKDKINELVRESEQTKKFKLTETTDGFKKKTKLEG